MPRVWAKAVNTTLTIRSCFRGSLVPAPVGAGFEQRFQVVDLDVFANSPSAMRGALFFNNAGLGEPIAVLSAWLAGGLLLTALAEVARRRVGRRLAAAAESWQLPPKYGGS